MEVVQLNQMTDAPVMKQIFPDRIRRTATAFFAAVSEDAILGMAALGYEEETLLIRYLFVPEPYRRRGVATTILNEISSRLSFVTDSFLEVYFDREDDFEGLKALFDGRPDYLLKVEKEYAVAFWSGISPEVLES